MALTPPTGRRPTGSVARTAPSEIAAGLEELAAVPPNFFEDRATEPAPTGFSKACDHSAGGDPPLPPLELPPEEEPAALMAAKIWICDKGWRPQSGGKRLQVEIATDGVITECLLYWL
jgi:hypothetical protein